MKVTIINEEPNAPQSRNTEYKRWGEWGRVDSQNPDNTINLLLDSGVFLRYVPVACKEWFVLKVDSEKEFNAGERDIPPVNARVFVFMPSYTFNDCFVAPFSGIYTNNKNEAAPFIKADKQKIREAIAPSGWHITDDYVTGSHKSVSPDGKTSLEIDYGTEEAKEENPKLRLNIFDNIKADIKAEDNVHLSVFNEIIIDHTKKDSCTIKIFDTELVIKKGEVSIKPKKTTIDVDGNLTVKTSGDATVEAKGNAKIKATGNITIQGATVELN